MRRRLREYPGAGRSATLSIDVGAGDRIGRTAKYLRSETSFQDMAGTSFGPEQRAAVRDSLRLGQVVGYDADGGPAAQIGHQRFNGLARHWVERAARFIQ